MSASTGSPRTRNPRRARSVAEAKLRPGTTRWMGCTSGPELVASTSQGQAGVPLAGPATRRVLFLLIAEVGRVAVVAVGDGRPAGEQVVGDVCGQLRVGDRPERCRPTPAPSSRRRPARASVRRSGSTRPRRRRRPRRRGRWARGSPSVARAARGGRRPGPPSCSRAAGRCRPRPGRADRSEQAAWNGAAVGLFVDVERRRRVRTSTCSSCQALQQRRGGGVAVDGPHRSEGSRGRMRRTALWGDRASARPARRR